MTKQEAREELKLVSKRINKLCKVPAYKVKQLTPASKRLRMQVLMDLERSQRQLLNFITISQ